MNEKSGKREGGVKKEWEQESSKWFNFNSFSKASVCFLPKRPQLWINNHIEPTLTEWQEVQNFILVNEVFLQYEWVCIHICITRSNRNLMVQINELIITLYVLMESYINLGAPFANKFILLVVITWVGFIANSLTCH